GEQIFVSEPLVPGINPLHFAVPPTAIAGNTFIRFRFSSHGGLAPIGTAQDGEVEDYIVKIEDDPNPNPNDETDWGDAPLNYPVLAADNGAHHFLTNGLMLGILVDSEGNGQPSANATRDDLDSASDDEDGITFTSSISPGANATIVAVSTMAGRLDAWIDFDQDGDWTDPGEQIFASVPVVGGPNNLNFLVPASASTGGTFARFRLSSGGSLSPEGAASDGEVEDYKMGIEQGSPNGELDWGDAPDKPYPTLAVNHGAVHLIAKGVYLGTRVDPEADGQPDPFALGDDNDGSDDDDGVTFSPLQQGVMAQVTIEASTKGYINAWIDFDLSGSWDVGEQIILNSVVVAGFNIFNFAVPSSAVVGSTATRIRFNSAGGLGPTGYAPDGEVEDYVVRIEKNPNGGDVDWGDARDPSFPTLAASNGASHRIDNLFLGETVDPEPDGQPSAWALGDDSDGNDDEDGIIFLTPIISGSTALVRVLPTMTGILDAWIDFDGDGTWTQPDNRIFNNETVNPGQVLAFKVPKVKKPLKATGRFRLSHGGSDYEGHEIGGEVEDYLLRICKLIGWELNPDLLQDQIEVTWTGERGMIYQVQSSLNPQEWIQENLGEEEVARADDLFPTGLAWNPVAGGSEHEPHFVPHLPDWAGAASTGSPADRTGQRSGQSSHQIPIDRSKNVVLIRIIAAPE
ncbi:MAG: GEVED domain-containing protein, partial [Roseibacillus sp.]|nr:GEVED domain-containing protein [Roseibacillus sp.]